MSVAISLQCVGAVMSVISMSVWITAAGDVMSCDVASQILEFFQCHAVRGAFLPD